MAITEGAVLEQLVALVNPIEFFGDVGTAVAGNEQSLAFVMDVAIDLLTCSPETSPF